MTQDLENGLWEPLSLSPPDLVQESPHTARNLHRAVMGSPALGGIKILRIQMALVFGPVQQLCYNGPALKIKYKGKVYLADSESRKRIRRIRHFPVRDCSSKFDAGRKL